MRKRPVQTDGDPQNPRKQYRPQDGLGKTPLENMGSLSSEEPIDDNPQEQYTKDGPAEQDSFPLMEAIDGVALTLASHSNSATFAIPYFYPRPENLLQPSRSSRALPAKASIDTSGSSGPPLESPTIGSYVWNTDDDTDKSLESVGMREDLCHDEEAVLQQDDSLIKASTNGRAKRDIQQVGSSEGIDNEPVDSPNRANGGTLTAYDQLPIRQLEDYDIVKQPRKYFTRGRVFMAPWPETAGPTTRDTHNVTTNQLGEQVYSKVRWFVVLKKHHDHCLAVPVHTFRGRGSLKVSTRLQHDALAFAVKKGEDWDRERLSRTEIPIVVENQNIDIAYPQSRIEFTKIYTIEYYLKIRNIGFVHKEALNLLEECFSSALDKSLPNSSEKNKSNALDAMGTDVVDMEVSETAGAVEEFQARWNENPQSNQDMSIVEENPMIKNESFFEEQILGVSGENDQTSEEATRLSGTTQLDLHPLYVIHNASEFRIGRVFKVLWAEPGGHNPTGLSYSAGQVHQAIRRFVIVRRGHGCCQCIPLTSYGRRGTLGRGVDPDEHAIVYTGRWPPRQLANERLPNMPIRMLLDTRARGDRLDPMTRLNYGKVYTVETNVRVYFIGRIHDEDLLVMLDTFNSVW